LIAAFTFPYFY